VFSSGSHPDEVLALTRYRYSYLVHSHARNARRDSEVPDCFMPVGCSRVCLFDEANTESTASLRTVSIRWGAIALTKQDAWEEGLRPSKTVLERLMMDVAKFQGNLAANQKSSISDDAVSPP
jgi:hypothetical protein